MDVPGKKHFRKPMDSFLSEIRRLLEENDEVGLEREVRDFCLESQNVCALFKVLSLRAGTQLTIEGRRCILQSLSRQVSTDCPPHLSFAGHKDSLLQLPSVTLHCRQAYTLSIWLNISADSPPRGFLLFRCRCPSGGIDAMVTDRQGSRWLITLRSYFGGSADKDETRNVYIVLKPESWHLVSIHHSAASSILTKPKVSIFIDGRKVERENPSREDGSPTIDTSFPLVYPFQTSPIESQWKFAVGFRGKMASCSFYPEELTAPHVAFLHSLGPTIPNHAHGVSFPQATFDSGHTQLGSLYAKSLPVQSTFCWNPNHLLGNACLPYVATGKFNIEHIDMSQASSLKFLIPIIHGVDSHVIETNCLNVWNAVGGVYLVLYLLWDYCVHVGAVADTEVPRRYLEIESVIGLLASMIRVSPDFKEQFIQLHGFHVLSHLLMKMVIPKRTLISETGLVTECIALVQALGPDASKGDGIASALQGLLLDFRLWKNFSRSAQLLVLEGVADLVSTCKEQIFKSIGVQSILDLLRLHVCTDDSTVVEHQLLVGCADAGQRLLQYAVEAAIAAKEGRSKTIQEPALLLVCLDASSSCILSERILNVLLTLRTTFPGLLLKALNDHRFASTTVISLLTLETFSFAVRKDALVLLLWNLGETGRQMDLIQLRSARVLLDGSAGLSHIPPESREAEIERIRQAKFYVKPLEKAWMTMSMLAESIDAAIHEGVWQTEDPKPYEAVVNVLAHDGPLGTVNTWLVLPLLFPLLKRQKRSLELCQRVLMSINVSLKMDEIQCESLGVLADRLWCKQFIDLACMGEEFRPSCATRSECSIAETCTELALDAFSTVLELKTRYHGGNSSETWKIVQECLGASCTAGTPVELKFLKRCVSLVFQRLARRGDGWNANAISSVVNILGIIENRRLCYAERSSDGQQILCFMIDVMGGLRKAAAGGALDGMERRALRPANRVLLGSMQFASDETAERICVEVITTLQYNTEMSGSTSEKYFRDFMAKLFSQLRAAIHSNSLDDEVRDRYRALVYHIMHHFIDLRHTYASKGSVPAHVAPTLEALTGIDTQKECNVIFDMLEKKFDLPKLNTVPDEEVAESWRHPMLDDHAESLLEATLSTPVASADEFIVGSDGEELSNLVVHVLSHQLSAWLKVRRAIVDERKGSERVRLLCLQRTQDVASAACARHWTKLHRKIATEYLGEVFNCEWKLGVSHEGPFPGRKRVVLRPRYKSKVGAAEKTQGIQQESALDLLKVGRELSRVYRSVTAEPLKAENLEEGHVLLGDDESSQHVEVSTAVDWESEADSLDDRGRDHAVITGPSSAVASNSDGDLLGDVKHMDEKFFQGRGTETGPALPGTRKMSSVNAKVTFEARVMLVTASGNTWGSLSFNGKEIFFASVTEPGRAEDTSDSTSVNLASIPRMRRRRWALSTVSAVYLRRYRLRNSALEVFFRRGKHRNFFVDFGHTEADERAKNEFARALMSAAPKSAFLQWPTISNLSLVRIHGVQAKWLNGEISNFDYLMALNTISGRTFNDLCQYPVMPWVIAQYTERALDLKDPSTYRDLSKPMGALNESRLREFLDRYESFGESGTGDLPPFMYGSHYSTMVGVVLHYLVRIQPFADLHREMQGSHFDVADRLFSSIPRTWLQNTTQLSEVKEITPEWYTTPEIFKNVNNFAFGKTQDGEIISDVTLPPWAKTPEEFVRLNREALESDYVSEHLHEWIDLIFGCKQQLPESEKANNVFFYLTYADQVDWKKLSQDEAMRTSTELQISHFGQTPMLLFNTPHPKRGTPRLLQGAFVPRQLKKCFMPSASGNRYCLPVSVEDAIGIHARAVVYKESTELVRGPVLSSAFIASSSRIVSLYEGGVVEVVKFGLTDGVKGAIASLAAKSKRGSTDRGLPDESAEIMHSIPEPILFLDREVSAALDAISRIPIATNLTSDRLSNVVLITPSGRYALAGGKLDGSICVREIDRKSGFIKTEGDFRSHRSPVLHIAADTIPNATTDAIASCDASGLVLVWTVSEIRHQIGNLKDAFERESVISRRPQRVFRCVPSPDVCCDISCKMGIVVVCCGIEVNVFSIERDERLQFFRATDQVLSVNDKRTARRLTLCNDGIIVMHVERIVEILIDGVDVTFEKEHNIEAYSLGGNLLASVQSTSSITFLQSPIRGDVTLVGHADGKVGIFRSHNLEELISFMPHASCVLAHPASWNVAQLADMQASPIVHVKAGPNAERPAILIISTQAGTVYLRPLPDFVKWERDCNPSAFSQLVSVPLEAVRGTIQSAHSTVTQLQANAQTMAANASRLADDAVSEFKRLFGGRR